MNDQVDMSQFIAARSDQLNADDLMDNPRTITITKVTASPDSAEQPVSIHYEGGEGRPFKPCKTMRRIMVAVWGKDASQYVGRSMTLYRDPDVQFGGMKVGGIRVSHMSHLPEKKTVALLVTRGRKAPYTVNPLKDTPAATKPDTRRGKAENWLAWLKNEIDGADKESVIDTFADAAPTLAKMKTEYPDIYTEAMKLAPIQPDLSADAGPDDEGGEEDRPDPQTNDVKTAAEEAVEKVVVELAEAKDLKAVVAIEKAQEPHKAFLPEHLAAILETSIEKAKLRLPSGVPHQ